MFEVQITSHWSGKSFNVNLISWDKRGSGMAVGKAFNVSEKEALKTAKRVAKIYDAQITNKTELEGDTILSA